MAGVEGGVAGVEGGVVKMESCSAGDQDDVVQQMIEVCTNWDYVTVAYRPCDKDLKMV